MRGPASKFGEKTGLVPNWLHAKSSHPGMGVEGVRNQVHFARMFTKDGSGRRDYVWIEILPMVGDTSRGGLQYIFHAWRNDGSGGTQRKSDWDRYGDLTGDGKDDYIQIRPDGDVEVWGNIGQYGEWRRRGVVHNIGPVDPRFIHIGDYDGDGKADILKVNGVNGEVTVIRNRVSSCSDLLCEKSFLLSRTRLISWLCL
jgi:hypothetical protein